MAVGARTLGESHPDGRLGVDVVVGELPGIEVVCVEASGVELDEGSASGAEAVAIGAVLVEIDAGGRSRVEAAACATTCIGLTWAEADAAGAA